MRSVTQVPTLYRSEDPRVLDAWHEFNRVMDEWHVAVGVFDAEFPDFTVVYSRQPWAILGLDNNAGTGHGPPGPLWRHVRARGRDLWVPNRRTNDGKALDQRMRAIVPQAEGRGLALPGMPSTCFDTKASTFYYAGFREFDGVLWASWGCDHELVEQSGWSREHFDAELWQRGKASEFFALVEAAEEHAVNA